MRKRGILFICIGNSCRSIMAEAIARHRWKESLETFSAGVYPLGHITPYTLQVLRESHIPTDGLHSKGLDAVDFSRLGVVVDLAGFPTEELVPPWFDGRIVKAYVRDPYGGTVADFREAMGAIKSLLEERLDGWMERDVPKPA